MVIEFNDLPPELVIAIVSRLNYGDMCNCLTLNKKTRAIINTNLHLIPRMWITNISLVREEVNFLVFWLLIFFSVDNPHRHSTPATISSGRLYPCSPFHLPPQCRVISDILC
ncbi:hypothetical protein Y032_0087g2083 [Ancylostoma ceylanicum]|uniref:F-box domain-containing protein n=1 Tax=Ancylostoma ceylanicum TaxID=53326 RepID=A0A016TNL0_9BILA|nr:hypothetical protein Y032_0087g2083 [Ancylostoma ceylanicum]